MWVEHAMWLEHAMLWEHAWAHVWAKMFRNSTWPEVSTIHLCLAILVFHCHLYLRRRRRRHSVRYCGRMFRKTNHT